MQKCRIGDIELGGNAPVRLIGVINCSPESFYTGSYVRPEGVYERACALIDSGADIIDLGARSTAFNAPEVTVEEERARIESALAELSGSGIPISVDTMHPEVLNAAINHDIDCINDIHGLCNTAFAKIAGDSGLPAILMAAYKTPGDPRGFDQVYDALEIVLDRAELFGIDDIILDPAVGRWTEERTSEDDWELCRRFAEFQELDRPLLAAVSRKTFIGDLLGVPPEMRLYGSLSAAYDLMTKGAAAVRAHDIKETRDIIEVFEKMNKSPYPTNLPDETEYTD